MAYSSAFLMNNAFNGRMLTQKRSKIAWNDLPGAQVQWCPPGYGYVCFVTCRI